MARRLMRVMAWVAGGGLLFVLFAAVLLFVVLETRPGHDFVLRSVLAQAPRFVQGEVEVRGIRSDGLLRGFTLEGVRIEDRRGRPFLEARSLTVRYAWRGLMRGEIVLVPVELVSPRIVLEQLHGDEVMNVARIFGPPEPPEEPAPADEPAVPEVEDDREPSTLTLLLQGVRIRDGELLVRLPVEGDEPPPRAVVETVPGVEGLHQRFFFSSIEASIEEADLMVRETGGQRLAFGELALVGQVFEEPFVIEDLRGVVEVTPQGLEADLERLWLPSTEMAGRVGLDWSDPDAGLVLDVALAADLLVFEDLAWLEPRLPVGTGRLDLAVTGPVASSRWRITDAELEVGETRLSGRVGFSLEGGFRFEETEIDARELRLVQLEPWLELEGPLPVQGRVNGRASIEGPLAALRVDGVLQFDDPEREIPPSNLRVTGVVEGGESPGVRDLLLGVDPLDYRTLRAFAPEFGMTGTGRLELAASGSPDEGITLEALLLHEPAEGEAATRIAVAGDVVIPLEEGPGSIRLALDGRLEPLDLDGIGRGLGQELPAKGVVEGPVRIEGALADLGIEVALLTPAGEVEVEGRLNVLEPAQGYRASGRVSDFELHTLLAAAPEPTVLSGRFALNGRGLTLDEVEGEGELELDDARIERWEVERFRTAFRAEEGRLHLDVFEVAAPWFEAEGQGDLALREGVEGGQLSLVWDVSSLEALGAIVLDEEPLPATGPLTELERLDLAFQGVDPDALPDAGTGLPSGRALGELHLRGALRDLEGSGYAELEEATYRDFEIPTGRLRFRGGARGFEELWGEGTLALEEPRAGRYHFERVELDGSWDRGEGRVRFDIERDEDEAYRLAFNYSMEEDGAELLLTELALDVDPVEWRLDEPTPMRIRGRSVEVARLRVSRPPTREAGTVRMEVDGLLDLEGDSDARVELEGVDIGRIAEVLQLEAPPAGFLDLTLAVRGPAEAPVIDGAFDLTEFEVAGTRLSRVEGDVSYANRRGTGNLTADLEGRRLLRAEARFPMDLAFTAVEERFPERSLDVTVSVDSLPAATVLAFLEGLEDVEGSIDGQIELRGTPSELRPSGEIRLSGGAVALPELGLRLAGIGGDLLLREDRSVEVDLEARARGTARVRGTISLEDFADPGFDLRVSASGLQAVDRRDLNARIGGEVTLRGRFTEPRVGGSIRVEQGTIFVEEFARTAEVFDLTDPDLFDIIDTTLVAVRPQLEAAQNPFIQNLRVDVDLSLQRDFWLRSREMNVEMGGDLVVEFDRPRREIVLVGTLEAIRGSYSAFGRTFQVQEGTVEFPGTPGIDPALDIVAVNRLRREGGEPLDIVANVGGTLQNLQIDLSSDSQPPIAQSDLISYLIFGRPSYALASGETSVLEGAAGAGVSVGVGAIATQLGSAVAQQIGLDYFTITQARDGPGLGAAAGLSGTFADTQIEVGQYLSDNLFLALVLRPLTGLGSRAQNQFPGARLEWRFTDLWTIEGFVEDRFAREGASGFGELGLTLSKVFGISLYREWGY